MVEFKVTRSQVITGKLYDDYLMFDTPEKADEWVIKKNSNRPGSVIGIEEASALNESKHEY